jgi:ankyrin repeat protein
VETPDKIYCHTLEKIKKADQELAHSIFQFVAVASCPLHIGVLAEFLAFDFTAQPIPKFHENQRWGMDAVLDAVQFMCSNLLSIVSGSSDIQFLHPSVKEYLTSSHPSDTNDTTSPLYHISKTPAHTRAAQACLGILLHLDGHITQDSLQNYPLAKYAAVHWVDHTQFEDVQQDVEEELRCLFDPNKPHLAVSVWIHDPAIPSWRRTERAERPSQLSGTHLHYAALHGLHRVVDHLITKHSGSLDVNSPGFDDKSTPLHVASSRGYMKVACILLDHGADVAARDKFGLTPLLQACRKRHVQVAHILLDHGADPSAKAKHGWTPLHEVSSGGHMELARTLVVRGANVNTQDRHGWTPYQGALSGRHAELAHMLFKNGADTKTQDKSLSLHEASNEGYVDFAHVLLENGEDANAQDEHGSTPLHKASEGGHVEVVFLLLERDANARAQDKLGVTPLHLASRRGHVEVAHALLKLGADAAAQDKISWTPLHYLCGEGHVEVARILLKYGASATAQDRMGWTPLHGASFGGHVKLARCLLEHGAKATARDKQGGTPLHQASGRGHAKIARILLDNDAEVGAKDEQGWTPLHRALSMGDVQVARLLLNFSKDTREARDKDGRTPVDCALPGMSEELPQLLSDPSHETSGAGRRCTMQ